MKNIIVFTCAYNAEKTISRCVNSILNQSISNWKYYIVDHGSTDRTSEILSDYAGRDPRITVFYHTQDEGRLTIKYAMKALTEHSDKSFFCTLDADDEYKCVFFEKMLCFMSENKLDVAACGTDFLNAHTRQLNTCRCLPKNLVIDEKSLKNHFAAYYQFMRTIWGKLYSLSLLRRCDFNQVPALGYGSDTYFTLEAFGHANRAGFLAETLHNYYMFEKSVSSHFNTRRIESDRVLFEFASRYLLKKCAVTKRNIDFLYGVYLNAIKDTIQTLVQSEMETVEKLRELKKIVSCSYTQKLISSCTNMQKERDELFNFIIKWTLTQTVSYRSKGASLSYEILTTIDHGLERFIAQTDWPFFIFKLPEIIEYLLQKNYAAALTRLKIWYKRHSSDEKALSALELQIASVLNKPDNEIFELLIDMKKKRPRTTEALSIDTKIHTLLNKNNLLQKLSPDFCCFFKDCVSFVLKNKLVEALEVLLATVQNVDLENRDIEPFLELGLNLSAISENADAFIYFKKLWIFYSIRQSKKDEALVELEEFEKILPNDEDFKAMRMEINL